MRWKQWIEESIDEAGLAPDLLTVALDEGDELLHRLQTLAEHKPTKEITAADLAVVLEESGFAVAVVKTLYRELDETLEILKRKPAAWKFWYRLGLGRAQKALKEARRYVLARLGE